MGKIHELQSMWKKVGIPYVKTVHKVLPVAANETHKSLKTQ